MKLDHWKSTVIGAVFAGMTTLTGVINFYELSNRQLCMIFGFAVMQFLFGLWVHDPKAQ